MDTNKSDWKITGLCILAIRFVQGWIYWGGGSRRFIYAPQKLDPYSATWMANKLQSAMPGAILDTGAAINFLLTHFYLLYISIILFSLVELFSGIALITGFFTRTAGFVTALLSISLMLIFGWQGSTCLDEWTMAVSNLSMGLTLALAGGSAYSLDAWLIKRNAPLAAKPWFPMLASGPVNLKKLYITSIAFFIFTIIFTLGTYNYYRGAIYSRYHVGPVSAIQYHVSLANGELSPNGTVKFAIYMDAGNASVPDHVMRIELTTEDGNLIETWEGKELSTLPNQNIKNIYAYNRIDTGLYGIIAPVSAKATIILPPTTNDLSLLPGEYRLLVYTIDGRKWLLNIRSD